MNFLKKVLGISILIILGLIIGCGSFENGILLTLLSFVIIYLFVKKVNIKRFYILLIIISLVTKITFVLIVDTPILDDYYIMWEAATNLINGNKSFLNDYYFITWGYQLFHVFYEALVLKVINNIIVLKILNCIYSTVITLLIYKISAKLTNESSGRIVSLLYVISLYPLYLNSVLGNQQLSLMLTLIGVYLFLFKKTNLKNIIFFALLLGISHLERPEAIIYILTAIIYLILNNKKKIDTFKYIIVMLLIFMFVIKFPSYIMIKSGVNEIGFANKNPEWKFLLGLNYDTFGKYSLDDEVFFDNKYDEINEIKRRIKRVDKLPNLMYQKIKLIWLYNDLGNAINNKQFSNNFMNLAINYVKVMNYVIIVIALFGVYKRKDKLIQYEFFIINLILYFGVYLFIEVSTRYYFNPNVTVMILSSLGISILLEKTNKFFNRSLK